ncbi:DUF4192 domain-containing protein [Actinosynnema sp. NPDC023587]|uniref:DUF4192 domain-containing protein n=1 Tax=Actinosynnema sp. NPDC023587 TaxID=3154695 RepID=UPI0033FF24CD
MPTARLVLQGVRGCRKQKAFAPPAHALCPNPRRRAQHPDRPGQVYKRTTAPQMNDSPHGFHHQSHSFPQRDRPRSGEAYTMNDIPIGTGPFDTLDSANLSDPGDLIAAVPHLLEFYPTDSLVAVMVRDGRITLTARIDLPSTSHQYRQTAHDLSTQLHSHDADRVYALIVGDDHDCLSYERLAAQLSAVFATDGLTPVIFGVPTITRGARWFEYGAPDNNGALPDPETSPIHLSQIARGVVTRPSREALVNALRPDSDEALSRRARLLADVVEQERIGFHQPQAAAESWYQLVRRHVERARYRTQPLTDTEIVDLAFALSHLDVRDRCMEFALGKNAGDAEGLWTELTRQCPAPECAEPAALLAIYAYVRGQGVLAVDAIRHALDAAPDHRLAGLLGIAFEQGMKPGSIRRLLMRTAELFRRPAPASTGTSTEGPTTDEEK